MAGSKAAFLCP